MAANSIKQWEVPSSTGKHFDVLDGIRGIAILMVVFYHTIYVNPNSGLVIRTIGGLIGTGWIGVPIFFVLSGFLISYPFFRLRAANDKHWYPQDYGRRRVAKIGPPFYLSIVVFTLFYLLRFSDPTYLYTALQWASGLANFIQPAHPFSAYWSLIVEAHFYLLLPFLFLATRSLGVRPSAVLLFLILFVTPLIARQLVWPEHGATRDEIAFLTTRFPCALDHFAWGVLFSGVFVSLSTIREEVRVLSLLGYAGLILLAVSCGFWVLWSSLFNIEDHPARWSMEVFHLLTGASAFLMLFFVFDPQSIGSRLLGHTSLRFVGLVSYEWFLFHQPIVALCRDLFAQSRGNIAVYFCRTGLPIALTFVLSVMVYRFFSLPLMNRIRGKKPIHPKQPAASPHLGADDKLANPTSAVRQ